MTEPQTPEEATPQTRRFAVLPMTAIFLAIVAIVGALYVSDLTTYGPTWDEFFHRPTGQSYLRFLRTGDLQPILKDEHAAWFPPVAVTIGAWFLENPALERRFPAPADRFHCGAIFFASLTAGLVYLIGHRATGCRSAGLLAALLLATHPQFVTHAHINVRDMGLMTFYALTCFILLVATQARRGALFWIALAGLVGGMGTAAKQNGAFLIPVGLAWMVLNIRALGFKRLVIGGALYMAGFAAAFFASWPYLWVDTAAHLREVWRFMTDPVIIAITTTFYDKIYTAGIDLPFYYPWVMLTILTPPAFIFLSWTGAVASVARFFRGDVGPALPFLWLVLPLSRFFVPKSAVCYDQIRHILEVLPALALLAAIAVWSIPIVLRRFRWSRMAAVALGGAVFLFNLSVAVRYRPFGTAYFNWMAGDAAYVTHAFDVEFWGNVYREAGAELNKRYPPNLTYFTAGLGNHILREAGVPNPMTDRFEDDFQLVAFMNKQNYLRNSAYARWLVRTKKPVFTIERDGKILFWAFEPDKAEYQAGGGT